MKPLGRSLNVVMVASELPYPATSGGRIRTLNLALKLARKHRITVISHHSWESTEGIQFLRERGIETVLADRAVAAKSGPCFYMQLLANMASPVPFSVAIHSSTALRRAVRSHAQRHCIDIWQAGSSVLAGALVDLAGAPKVLDAQNIESLIWRRYYEHETSLLKRWYIREQWRKFERFERRSFDEATRVVSVSEHDAALIRDRFGVRNVDVVDNGIDRAYFEAMQPNPDPKMILFLGSLDWRPNLDAVGLLLDRIFPAVRAAEPSARLRLVGRKPPWALVQRARKAPGVELYADVPDVRPFLTTSGVLVVSLRIGGGSRLKILEAMAAGLPVISTPVGAEGLDLVPGKHYLAAEPERMADELLAYIRDPRPARAMAGLSRTFVLNRYDWNHLADRLEGVWFACLEDEAPAKR